MTLEEKATLLTGDSAWTTAAMPRLGLPSLRMADGPHGVRRTQSTGSMAFGAQAATCFPTASSTAATWDPDLLREMGEAIATRGHRPRGRRRPRARGQHEAIAAVRPELRVLLGGPIPGRASRRRMDRRRAVARGRCVAQASCRQQPGDAPDVGQRRGRRAHAPRDLPAGLRARGQDAPDRGPSCAPTTGSTASMRRSTASC